MLVLNGFLPYLSASTQVLKSISGVFKPCEISAVMGPSGSGKSTLLNILSGYIANTRNISGDIEVNHTRKRSYILQEENLHGLLTVDESMMFSINVKTGFQRKIAEKKKKVKSVLDNLGLNYQKNAFVRDLSGGQLKRLSIAQELVDDPLVLFLDEPTTGLDSSSATFCIQVLKKLALQGRTIICTIHTPSALLFKQFDHLYALAEGRCIYQGSSLNLIPFLSECGLTCPESYNVPDFLMEIANGEYGTQNEQLTEKIFNGENENFRRAESSKLTYEEFDMSPPNDLLSSSNFFEQLWYLIMRNFLILYRDKMILWLRLAIHIVVAVSVGAFFVNVGSEASKIFSNFKMIYAMTMFLVYTGFYSMVTRFPLENSTIKREHFNNWYSTCAYNMATTIADVPLTIICTTLFVIILYAMTSQPLDEFRFTTLLNLEIFVCFVAQGFGMMIGSFFSLMVACFFYFFCIHINNL